VLKIWVNYTASDPEFPANVRAFEHWIDEEVVYVNDAYEPQSGDVMRVFYTTMQTLNGLDSETTTSYPDDDETLLALGAAGYAATSRAVDLTEQVTLDRLTSQQVRAWGLAKLQEFRAGLRLVARKMATEQVSHVEVSAADRWEGTSWV
jgi:hypothetical protein